MRRPRGRITKPPEPSPKLEFGVHKVCPYCKGKGRRPGKKELCGGCFGSGIYEPPGRKIEGE